MNKHTLLHLLVAGWALLGAACQHDPSLADYNDDYTVYTNRDTTVDFADFDTYYLPGEILLIGNSDEARYWSDSNAQQLIAAVNNNLIQKGYTPVDDKAAASFGMQLSYVERVTYYVGYNDPYWWWNYPYYWNPGYWGSWYGWHYPYYVQYGYAAGSLLIEMVNLEAPQTGTDSELPVVWSCYIGGLLTASDQLNLQRALTAVEQAFVQSPYLNSRLSAR